MIQSEADTHRHMDKQRRMRRIVFLSAAIAFAFLASKIYKTYTSPEQLNDDCAQIILSGFEDSEDINAFAFKKLQPFVRTSDTLSPKGYELRSNIPLQKRGVLKGIFELSSETRNFRWRQPGFKPDHLIQITKRNGIKLSIWISMNDGVLTISDVGSVWLPSMTTENLRRFFAELKWDTIEAANSGRVPATPK